MKNVLRRDILAREEVHIHWGIILLTLMTFIFNLFFRMSLCIQTLLKHDIQFYWVETIKCSLKILYYVRDGEHGYTISHPGSLR